LKSLLFFLILTLVLDDSLDRLLDLNNVSSSDTTLRVFLDFTDCIPLLTKSVDVESVLINFFSETISSSIRMDSTTDKEDFSFVSFLDRFRDEFFSDVAVFVMIV
jgi:hypothetical protein